MGLRRWCTSLMSFFACSQTWPLLSPVGATGRPDETLSNSRVPILVVPADLGGLNADPIRTVSSAHGGYTGTLGGKGEYAVAKWSRDYRFMFARRRTDRALVFFRYDLVRGKFTGPFDISANFARDRIHYTVVASTFDISPNGDQLICGNRKDGVWVVDLRSGRKETILSSRLFPSGFHDLAWNPRAREFAFSVEGRDSRNESDEPFDDIWLARLDGSHLRKLGHGWRPHWAGSGRALLCVVGRGQEARLYDTVNRKFRTLRKGVYESVQHAVFSPDGKYIAIYEDYRPEIPDRFGLFLMDTSGRIIRKLAAGDKVPVDVNDSVEW